MSTVDRFTVSLDTELLAAFDAHIAGRGYVNRSEAIRDLIRDSLTASRVDESNGSLVAVITFVCDLRSAAAPARVRTIILDASQLAPGAAQVPLDDSRDLWVITARGPAQAVHELSNAIRAVRGISSLELTSIPIG